MKKVCILVVLLCAVSFIYAQGFALLTKNPRPGEMLSFNFNPQGTNLQGDTPITCKAMVLYDDFSPILTSVSLKKEGDTFVGHFPLDKRVTVVAFQFQNNQFKEDKPQGNIILMKDAQGKDLAINIVQKALLYSDIGKAIGIEPNLATVVSLFERAFSMQPALKGNRLDVYMGNLYALDKTKALKVAKNEIIALRKLKNLSEIQLQNLSLLYDILDNQKASTQINKQVLQKFPKGEKAYITDVIEFNKAESPAEKEKLALALVEKFQLHIKDKAHQAKLNNIYQQLAEQYLDEPSGEKFLKYSSAITDPWQKALLYNSFARNKTVKKENIPLATQISKLSFLVLDSAKRAPVSKGYYTRDEYVNAIENSYGDYANTYAWLLYENGDYKGALDYQDKVMKGAFGPVRIDHDMAERYVTYLVKNNEFERAFKQADELLRKDMATDSLKNMLKTLLLKLHKTEDPEVYIAQAQAENLKQLRSKWSDKMINEPAPGFILKNLKGEEVDLNKLKGKIVILDYWATWCVPCIKSFPGMQQAVNNYADNPNVVFLFINTWERENETDRWKNIRSFMNKTGFNFNVLMDERNPENESKYQVVEKYQVQSIPAKFIIDKNGNIRFRTTGSSSSVDVVLKEINIMIDLLLSEKG